MAFKIYTKTGDTGDTSLFGGKRLTKSHIRIEADGTVDELNANIGVVSDSLTKEEGRQLLKEVQDRLFDIGAHLATAPGRETPALGIQESDIGRLEAAIDAMEQQLPELKNFVLPGGHPLVSACHIARCVCRRAERRVVALGEAESVPPLIIRYLNRLSDYLFVLARYIGRDLGVDEVIWTARK